MPAETVEWIIGRALTDLAYRQRLLGSPDEALAGYDLTAEQTIEIKSSAGYAPQNDRANGTSAKDDGGRPSMR